MAYDFEFCPEIAMIDYADWNQLAKGHYPFLQYEFLAALEKSGAVNTESGWQPFHLLIRRDKQLIAAAPLYIKSHSYGEYVFDWSWADAYRRYGFEYYPKLIAAIPFTPVTGSRLMMHPDEDRDTLWKLFLGVLGRQVTNLSLSSLHILFPPESAASIDIDNSWSHRCSVQFQWFNDTYQSFEHFLASFSSRKRKNVRKERAKLISEDIIVNRVSGNAITSEQMAFFFDCYQQTYLKRSGHSGYLSHAFFQEVRQNMPEKMLLVEAQKAENKIASALYFFDEQGLYGRYWGALQDVDGLHFECCYYQGIEFCIERNIPLFNPGTQGEHKIQRGFKPIWCHSLHWLEKPEFNQAIKAFIESETPQLRLYHQDASKMLPFKQSC